MCEGDSVVAQVADREMSLRNRFLVHWSDSDSRGHPRVGPTHPTPRIPLFPDFSLPYPVIDKLRGATLINASHPGCR